MADLIWTLHTVSGAVARVPEHFLDHPVFGEYLVEVEPHAKPYDPELWKPTTAAEYKSRQVEAPPHQDEEYPFDPEHEE